MRLSAEPGDPGCGTYQRAKNEGRRIDIRLDGIEQTKVITADDTEGFIKRYASDAKGELIHSGKEFATEIVRGFVTIFISESRSAGT